MDNISSVLFNELFKESNFSYAMAFVPFQPWQNLYEPDVGLTRGTIFMDLDKPYLGREAIPCG